MNSALVVVDLQRDFLDGGVVPCPGSSALLPRVSELAARARARGVACIFTRDWHPSEHSSFRHNDGPWAVHCVEGTPGAEFPPELVLPAGSIVIDKGVDASAPGYSGFEGTDLDARLRVLGVDKLAVCGVATEHCVRATVLDALAAGFEVSVLIDLVRPVKVADGEQALVTMQKRGAHLVASAHFERSL